MAFAATLANDLHIGPLARRWMLASSYRKQEKDEHVCVCVFGSASGGRRHGSSECGEEPDLEQRLRRWQTCLWSL